MEDRGALGDTADVVNEPRPWMLTVGELRRALSSADEHQVVLFALPPEHLQGVPEALQAGVTLVFNVRITGGTGPVFGLTAARPTEGG